MNYALKELVKTNTVFLTASSFFEFHKTLECAIVCESHGPVELDTATAFMEVHLHCFFLLLEDL